MRPSPVQALLLVQAVDAVELILDMDSVVDDLHARLFAAVQARDVAAARALNDRLLPLASVFYAPLFVDLHNRMNEALVLLGRLERAIVRPPLVGITDAERGRIAEALRQVSWWPRAGPSSRRADTRPALVLPWIPAGDLVAQRRRYQCGRSGSACCQPQRVSRARTWSGTGPAAL